MTFENDADSLEDIIDNMLADDMDVFDIQELLQEQKLLFDTTSFERQGHKQAAEPVTQTTTRSDTVSSDELDEQITRFVRALFLMLLFGSLIGFCLVFCCLRR